MQGRLPSPASVLAAVALFAAVVGSAYAGSKIDSRDILKGAVTAKKLAPGAVRSKAIANNAVLSQHIADGAVTGAKVADGAVTGAKVDESSLGLVPSAADSATVGGLRVQKFFAKPVAGSALATIATLGTLELRGGCSAGGRSLLEIRPASGAASQSVRSSAILGNDDVETQGQGTLPPGGITVLSGSQPFAGVDGAIEAASAAGAVTTIQWAVRDANNFVPSANPESDKCFIWGTATSG